MNKIAMKEKMLSYAATLLAMVTVLAGYFLFKESVTAFATGGSTPPTNNSGSIPTVTVGTDGVTIGGAGFDTTQGSAWTQILGKYRGFIVGISGVAAVTMIVVFIFHFVKLAGSAGNPSARSQALVGLMWSGIAAAGLGSVSLIVGLFYRSVA